MSFPGSLAEIQAATGGLWPYLVVIFIGFLPTELWRMLAVALSRGLGEESELLQWVRLVAAALLAAVVAKFIIAPTGALKIIPLWGRAGSLAVGISAFYGFRRSVLAAVLAGEATLIAAGYFGR